MERQRPDVRGWFGDDELEQCLRCGRKAALIPPSGGLVICTECGVVGVRAAAA